jgi:pSer/pThr/pTyr-binding forkhead associated (FHA) protein
MTCVTCGRENPSHLTFCQECGQRLGPRIAPPTPPIGLGGQDAYGPPPKVQADARQSPRSATSLGMTSALQDANANARAGSGDRRCRICDTVNGPSLRYCTSCGSTLEAAPAASVGVPAAIPVARVVDVSTGGPPVEAARICGRCRGTVDGGAQFCKFCGHSLSAGESSGAAGQVGAASARSYDRPELPRANGAPAPRAEAAQASSPQQSGGDRRHPGTAPIAQVPSQGVQAMRSGGHALAPSPSPIAPVAPPIAAPYSPPQPSAAVPQAVPRPASIPPPAAQGRASMPSASALQRGRLVVIAKSGADGPSYPFGDLLDIGRTDGHVVVSEDPYLSPRHVRILFSEGKLILRDLASTNGVYLRLAPSRDTTPHRASDSMEVVVPLVDQDLILVGQQVLRFDILHEGEGGFGPAQEHGTLLFGSPASPRYARLCQRTVEGIARDIYYIRKVETVLGRESGDVVFTEDPFLSRRHAAIRLLARDGGPAALPGGSKPPTPAGEARFALVDLGSSNGTFLRIKGDVELVRGDHFRVGQQLFRVDFDGARGARE